MSDIYPGWAFTANPDKDKGVFEVVRAAETLIACYETLHDAHIVAALEALESGIAALRTAKGERPKDRAAIERTLADHWDKFKERPSSVMSAFALADALVAVVEQAQADTLHDAVRNELRYVADLMEPFSDIGMSNNPTRSEMAAWLRRRADTLTPTIKEEA